MIDDAVYKLTFFQRALILIFVIMGTAVYSSSILVASAILPKMQGAFGATQDEVSWTMTFNIVATAVVTPMTGWLADGIGRRNTMVWCSVAFAMSTFMCGMATSLEEMIFWRIAQGAAGAPLVPLGQTLLLDSNPSRQHGLITALFGMGNMIGPVIAPTVGGEVSDLYGWQWAYWMIVPFAIITAVGFWFILPTRSSRERTSLDWSGFLTLSIAIAGAQIVFSRGQRLDWFQSTEIVVMTFLTAVALYMFVAHSLTAKRPFIRLSLFTDRNYALGMLLVFFYGMLNFAPVVLLPPLLQAHANFTDTAIGAFIGWRGLGTAIGFIIAMLLPRLDARLMMMIGFAIQAYGGYNMMQFDLNVSPYLLGLNTVIQGIGVGLAWVPITVVTFATLKPEYRAEAMGMFHLLRNFGSSLFISVAVAEIVRSSSANYARMTESISPFNNVWSMPWATGAWSIDTIQGTAKVAGEIARQSAMIGYLNAFAMYALVALIAVPICLLVRLPKRDS
ncbi:MAG: DHA2 family multidrug resistance protein [Hyphomicrobiaceae bacterium]|jgi:DHA2 family multidrug resistance protein